MELTFSPANGVATRKLQIYKCRGCGNLVEVLQHGIGGLSCCGAPLEFLGENRGDADPENYASPIDLIEVLVEGQSYWQFPRPGEALGGGVNWGLER